MIISQSEVASLMACPAKWSFGYGKLAGYPLKPKAPALRLREGRAWGAAVQAWHSGATIDVAWTTLADSLEADHQFMVSHGMGDSEELSETLARMREALIHYCATVPLLNLVGTEVELEMKHVDGWTYRCHLDGVHQDEDGYLWVVEFKLRGAGAFTPLEQIQLWRQVRWYALALEQAAERGQGVGGHPTEVRGVIVDERLNDAPKPVRWNKPRKDGSRDVSATQSCLPEEYLAACAKNGQVPHQPTLDRLEAKVWQQRHTVLFREDEMDDALRELEAAAQLLRLYHHGRLRPIRNPGRLCSTCAFLELCPDFTDTRLRDALYVPAEEVVA